MSTPRVSIEVQYTDYEVYKWYRGNVGNAGNAIKLSTYYSYEH